jgi:hypothetical protein
MGRWEQVCKARIQDARLKMDSAHLRLQVRSIAHSVSVYELTCEDGRRTCCLNGITSRGRLGSAKSSSESCTSRL